MNKRSLTIFILSLSIIIILIILIAMVLMFKLKYVEIQKTDNDFVINNEELVKYLDLKKNSSLFFYDYEKIKKKLLRIYFVLDAKVVLKLPSTMIIKIKIREPLAVLSGKNGELFTIDKDGIIYNNYSKNLVVPFLILDKKDQISIGSNIQESNKKIIDFLYFLKSNQINLYDAISQIEINKSNNYENSIIVNFRTYKQRIYLKNLINVDVIRRGLALVIFLDNMNIKTDKAVYIETGFIIK